MKIVDQQFTEGSETDECSENVLSTNNEETVSPHDDDKIRGDDLFIRGVTSYQIVADAKSPTGYKISSALFTPSSSGTKGISANLKSLLDKLSPEGLKELKAMQGFQGSVSLEVKELRGENLWVGLSPLTENPCHCEAWGNPKVSKGVQRRLLAKSTWDDEIKDVSLHV